MYRPESCVCSFLHVFSNMVFGMELLRQARVGCEGRSSQPKFELYLCLFLYEHLLGHAVPTIT